MLELGRAGSAGVERGTLPVLDGGVVVATVRTAKVREAATAAVGDREWVFTRQGRALAGRRDTDPEDSARFTATQTSYWKSTWRIDLEGTLLEMRTASAWRGTHRYLAGDRQVAVSGTAGRWLRLPTLTAGPELGLEAQVFLLWVELVLTHRSAVGAAAVAGGAAAAGAAG